MGKIMLYFVVSWTLAFRAGAQSAWTNEGRYQRFATKDDALAFIQNSPKGNAPFECINSLTSTNGTCIVSEMALEQK